MFRFNSFNSSFGGVGKHAPLLSNVALGGTVTTSGIYTIHSFTTSGTLTINRIPTAGNFDLLVVAGGGGGGTYGGGGGGAGGTYTPAHQAVAGTANTGGGGGGAKYDGGTGASGGSGIVIISYTTP